MGVTPNRGYPYPDLGDPMRITEDLQALAEAYDVDLQNVQNGIHQRTMFRAGATERQSYGINPSAQLRFDILERNWSGALVGSQTTMPRDSFIPDIPGLWGFTATVAYASRFSIEWIQLHLHSTTWVASTGVTEMPNDADGNRTLSVTGVYLMTGTSIGNPIYATVTTNSAVTRPGYALLGRSLTGFLLART